MTFSLLACLTLIWATLQFTHSITTENTQPSTERGEPITEEPAETSPRWTKIFDSFQATCTAAGCVANLMTLVTLIRTPHGFSRLILVLLRHQSLVDACVCALATALILGPPGWMTGLYGLDLIICHIWHSQAVYWGSVTLSTYNLVLIACERYLAICHPFTHGRWSVMSGKKIAAYIAVLNLVCIMITHGCYIQTRLILGECTNNYAFSGKGVDIYFFAFVIFTYITTYCIPAVTMAALYGLVAHRLRLRRKDNKLGTSKTINRASSQLTKTAVAVTVIFIITVGYDLHYYLLGYTGVTAYRLNSAVQKVGVFLSNLNSCANPVVYILLMPIYRLNLVKTFCPCITCKDEDNTESSNSHSNSKSHQLNSDTENDCKRSNDTLHTHM